MQKNRMLNGRTGALEPISDGISSIVHNLTMQSNTSKVGMGMHVEFDIPDELMPVFVDFIKKLNEKYVIASDIANDKKEVKEMPTREEVRNYIIGENIYIDPDRFYDYYEQRNWTDKSGSPINNWKSLAQSWQSTQWYPKKPSTLYNSKMERVDNVPSKKFGFENYSCEEDESY